MVWCYSRADSQVCPSSFSSSDSPNADIYHSRIADHIKTGGPESKSIIIDAFAGAGGNAIAFALSGRFKQVFAIEKDPATLACARHNAEVYGVASKIWWIEGDCFEVLKKRLKSLAKDAIVFASPPWGGRSPRSVVFLDSYVDTLDRSPIR